VIGTTLLTWCLPRRAFAADRRAADPSAATDASSFIFGRTLASLELIKHPQPIRGVVSAHACDVGPALRQGPSVILATPMLAVLTQAFPAASRATDTTCSCGSGEFSEV
jgi:hypothetical protein